MTNTVEEYHKKRIPFIIIPNKCIIIGDKNGNHSHTDLLLEIGISKKNIKEIIEYNPRGYFLNNKLVIYQGDSVKEGDSWLLKKHNYIEVKKFYPELKRLFSIKSTTKIFLGVYRGVPGTIWDTINEVPINFFEE